MPGLVAALFGPKNSLELSDLLASGRGTIRAIYCTVIDTAFVPRALALQRSIALHSPNAVFAFYCLDRATADVLQTCGLPQAKVVPVQDYETESLKLAKATRKLNEYCWTCKPAVLLHALGSYTGMDWAVWLDADMLAFGNLDSEFCRHPDASVILTPHRFSLPEFLAYERTAGAFNAGYVAFRNDSDGLAALNWWTGKCLEGCPAIPDRNRFADQKYLDAMAQMFPRVASSQSLGLNCAPWNVFEKEVEGRDGMITVAGAPMLLYHFQGLKIIREWVFDLYGARLRLPQAVRRLVYAPYLDALVAEMRNLAHKSERPSTGIDRDFVGPRGLFRGARRLRQSANLVVKFNRPPDRTC
jgi:hypothetical protein